MCLNLGLLISFSSPALEYPRTPYKVWKEMGGNLLCLAEKPSPGLSNTFCIRGPNIILEKKIGFFFSPQHTFKTQELPELPAQTGLQVGRPRGFSC